jgi:hypothetical protein
MNRTAALGIVCLLIALPSAAAAPPAGAAVDKETDTARQTSLNALHITERIEFRITDTAAYTGVWDFLIQADHSNLEVFASKNGNEQRLEPTIQPGAAFESVRINVSAVHPQPSTTDLFVLRFEYDVGTTYDRNVTTRPASLVIYAEPLAGQVPQSANTPAFFPAGTRYHAVANNPIDGYRYSLRFTSDAAAPATQDFNPFLFGFGGLAIGFLLALVLARRGVIAQGAKKFEKGGAMESRETLEARRRTLMAALKELELAHDAKEIPDAAYAPLKEEYKAQTVRVMRTLEGKKEPPA